MTPEKTFFLRLLADHLAGRTTSPANNLDWQLILQYARMHQVDGIVYYQCKRFLPAKEKALLQQSFISTMYYYENRSYTIQNIKESFRAQDIPMVTVKGMDLAACYPVPALRTMGDIDIIVHKEDKERASRALTELGFEIGEKNPDYDWACVYKGMQYELHHKLIYQETITDDTQEQFFNQFWQYVEDGKLDWSFHFLFLLIHMRKHLMNKGIGFRMFMDLAAVMEKIDSLNWVWIENKIEELNIKRYSQVCFSLIDKWFNVKAPVDYEQIDDSFLEEATEKIFANGIFGSDNAENGSNSAINKLIKYGNGDLAARIIYFFKSVFPSYNNMANSPYYRFIRGRSYLLPLAWGYRILRLALGRTKSVKENINKISTSREAMTQREQELRKWGLL